MTDQQQANGQDMTAEATPQQASAAEQSVGNDALAGVVKELAEARKQADDYKDSYLRSIAEYQNLKRRTERQIADIQVNANANLLRKILPVVDDFQRAIALVPNDQRNNPWMEGVMLIERKLNDVLRSEGVELIPSEGQPFDPNLHEAVMTEEVENTPAGMVTAEMRKGYKLGERVLRPAMVRVSR